MCGRLNITDDPFSQAVCEAIGVSFASIANNDLRPTENVSVIGGVNNAMVQLELSWGIKPDWAKRIIINAQAETVAVKPTFKTAFHTNRVVVPVSGWYEWSGEKANKQKFLFAEPEQKPLFMAGIALGDKLVTLTTKPNEQCAKYHHRMPLLLANNAIEQWIFADATNTGSLLNSENTLNLSIKKSI